MIPMRQKAAPVEAAPPALEDLAGLRVGFVSQPWERMAVPSLGSVELQTYWAARRLACLMEVTVYGRRSGGAAAREQEAGVEFRRFRVLHEEKLLRPLERLCFRDPARPLITSPVYHAAYAWQVANDARRRNFDILHIHNFSQFVPLLRRRNPRAGIVLHMHCEWLTQFDRDMLASRLSQADAIIGASEYITGRVRQRFPSLARRCHRVYNGVRMDAFESRGEAEPTADRSPRILFVGRISPEKGVHVLLRAFARVREKHPQATLDLVGPEWVATMICPELSDDAQTRELRSVDSGSYAMDIRRQAAAFGPHVRFHGFVPQHDLPRHYREADIFVFPSVCNEAFGIPVTEAMASGLPVVAARSGGVVEQVEHGTTGLLVERGDAEALAAALLHLIASPQLCRSMGDASARRARARFSWDETIGQLSAVYRSVRRR